MAIRGISKSMSRRPRKAASLTVKLDGVREVRVTGDFTGWSDEGVPLNRTPDGEWRVDLDLPPGDHQYRLRVDGEWRDDPSAPRRVPNPFGGENCVLTVD